METIDRYLRSIQFWLPASQKDDIIAELSEDIHSEVDEKERELGRSLGPAELRALLKRRGSPLLVAERYLPKRYLIGPTLFPVYWTLLRSFVLYFLMPWAMLWLCFTAVLPSYYAQHPSLAFFQTIAPMWTLGLNVIVGMTFAFALVERFAVQGDEGMRPGKMRAARDPNRVPRSNSIGEMVWNGFILLWWSDALRPPAAPDVTIKSSPAIAQYFYWPVLFFLMATVLVAAANFVWPVWTRRRAAIRLAVDIAGLGIAMAMLVMWAQGGVFIDLHASHASAARLASIREWVSASCVILLLLMGVSFVVRAFQDLRRTLGKAPSVNCAVRALAGE
jgi:hypothetical protein